MINNYRCKWCGGILQRESNKLWVPSFCEKYNKKTHLAIYKAPYSGIKLKGGDDGSYYTELRSYNRDLQAQKEAIIKELEGK